MKKWILGIYRRRLFDEKIEEESNSVVNQKKLIDDYLVDKDDIMIYKDYAQASAELAKAIAQLRVIELTKKAM